MFEGIICIRCLEYLFYCELKGKCIFNLNKELFVILNVYMYINYCYVWEM